MQKAKDAKKKTKTTAAKNTAATKSNGAAKASTATKPVKAVKSGEVKKTQAKKPSEGNQNAKKTQPKKSPSAKDVVISVPTSRSSAPKPKQVAKKAAKPAPKPASKPGTIDPHNVVIHVELPREPVKKAPKTTTDTRNQRAAATKQDIQNKREVLMANARAKKTAAPSSLSDRFSLSRSR